MLGAVASTKLDTEQKKNKNKTEGWENNLSIKNKQQCSNF